MWDSGARSVLRPGHEGDRGLTVERRHGAGAPHQTRAVWKGERPDGGTVEVWDDVVEEDWTTGWEQQKGERKRGAGEPGLLENHWWMETIQCTEEQPCGHRLCSKCRTHALRRNTQRAQAAWMIAHKKGATMWLVTATRKQRARSWEDIVRFRLAVKCLGAAMIQAGAMAIQWVYEVVVDHEERTDVPCHEGRGNCPLCQGTGKVPSGHLHAHGVVMLPKETWISWAWLQGLQDPRQLDPMWGNLDIGRGKQGNSIAMWGYVGGYIAQLKEPLAAPWFRRMAGNMRLTETQGDVRGATLREVYSWGHTEQDGRIGDLIRRVYKVRGIEVVTKERRTLDRTSKAGPRTAFRDAMRTIKEKRIFAPMMKSRWSIDADRWEEIEGSKPTAGEIFSPLRFDHEKC